MVTRVLLIVSLLLGGFLADGQQQAASSSGNPQVVLPMVRPRAVRPASPTLNPVHQSTHEEHERQRKMKIAPPASSGNKFLSASSSYFHSLTASYAPLMKSFHFLMPEYLRRQYEVANDDDDDEVAAPRQTPSTLLGLMVTVGKAAVGVAIAAGILVVINVVLTGITVLIGGVLVVQSLISLAAAGKMDELVGPAA